MTHQLLSDEGIFQIARRIDDASACCTYLYQACAGDGQESWFPGRVFCRENGRIRLLAATCLWVARPELHWHASGACHNFRPA